MEQQLFQIYKEYTENPERKRRKPDADPYGEPSADKAALEAEAAKLNEWPYHYDVRPVPQKADA